MPIDPKDKKPRVFSYAPPPPPEPPPGSLTHEEFLASASQAPPASLTHEEMMGLPPAAPERTFGGTAKDVGITAVKGVVGLGQAAVGAANLATGGLAGKGMDKLGYDPEATNEMLGEHYSDAQKEANRKLGEAEGFVGTAKTMIENPSTIGHAIIESLPLMFGGGAIARKGLQTLKKFAPKVAQNPGAAVVAGGAGEGVVAGGFLAENIRQQTEDKELSLKQGLMAVGGGIGTGIFGVVGGRIAERLGLVDVNTLLAGGASAAIRQQGVTGIAKRIVGGGISEGVFEEMPQEMQETMWENAALERPIFEGVPESAAQGLIVGAAMGMGVNVIPDRQRNKIRAALADGEYKLDDRVSAANAVWHEINQKSPELANNWYLAAQDAITNKKPINLEGYQTMAENWKRKQEEAAKAADPGTIAKISGEEAPPAAAAATVIDEPPIPPEPGDMGQTDVEMEDPRTGEVSPPVAPGGVVAAGQEPAAVQQEVPTEDEVADQQITPGRQALDTWKNAWQGTMEVLPDGVSGDLDGASAALQTFVQENPEAAAQAAAELRGEFAELQSAEEGGLHPDRARMIAGEIERLLGVTSAAPSTAGQGISGIIETAQPGGRAFKPRPMAPTVAAAAAAIDQAVPAQQAPAGQGISGTTSTSTPVGRPFKPGPLAPTATATEGSVAPDRALTPAFNEVQGGTRAYSVIQQVRRSPIEVMEVATGQTFDGKWSDTPAVSVKTIGGTWRTVRFSSMEDAHKFAEYLDSIPKEQAITEQAPEAEVAAVTSKPEIIEHLTKKGRAIRGIIRTDLTKDEALAIDPYTFAKDGGFFIREKHLTPEERGETGQDAAVAKGVIGEQLASGEVRLTATGRQTTPFPRIDTGSDRKAGNTLKRVDRWLMDNAIAEAESRGDDFNLRQFQANRDRPSQADKDSAELYLFDEQRPDVPPSIFKPLTSPTDTATEQEPVETETAEQTAPVAEDAAPPKSTLEQIQEMSDADLDAMITEARRWKGATQRVAEQVAGDKKKALALSRATTKGDLDAYLMKKFGVDETTARDVSNALTARNLDPDMTADPADFVGEAWSKVSPPVSKNTIVTEERADELRAKLRAKLKELRSGIDPELLMLGAELAVYHVERGARTFTAFARAMTDDLGEKAKDYLRSWYMAAKNWPGIDREGMDSEDTVQGADLDSLVASNLTNGIIQGEGRTDQPQQENDNVLPINVSQPAQEDVPGSPEAMATEDVRGAEGGGRGQPSGTQGGRKSTQADGQDDTGRNPAPRSRRTRPQKVHTAETGSGSGGVDLKDTPASIPATNFQITDDLELGKGGEVAKFNDNLAAIRTLKEIERAGRRATPDEQRILARYVGWGGLANAFANRSTGDVAKGWEDRAKTLSDLLTKEELDVARNSTKAAHYTSQSVVRAMWKAVKHLGFVRGAVLESSVGIGNFLGLAPSDIAGSSQFLGVEYDSITARIAKLLYPRHTVIHSGFQNVPVPENFFDLAIGNPPFGKDRLVFPFSPELNRYSIHNQFMLAGLNALKPGGIQAFVVSRYFLDAKDSSAREAISDKATLLGAIRLPDTAFKENARTEVVTDIIFLQKNPETVETAEGDTQTPSVQARPAWLDVTEIADPGGGDPMSVNAYFARNPDHVVGTMDRSGTMRYEGDITVHLEKGADLEALIEQKISIILPANIANKNATPQTLAEKHFESMVDSLYIYMSGNEEGSITLSDTGELVNVYERELAGGEFGLARRVLSPSSVWSRSMEVDKDGKWYSTEDKLDAAGKKVKIGRQNVKERKVFESEDLIPERAKLGQARYLRLTEAIKVLNLLKKQILMETEGKESDKAIEANRKELRAAYEQYRSAHGFMNDSATIGLIDGMPDGALLMALEQRYRKDISPAVAKKAGIEPREAQATVSSILKKRVIFPYRAPDKADSAADAMAVSLSEAGTLDMDRIASLLDTDIQGAIDQLFTNMEKPLIFRDTESGNWVPANEYLSGNVAKKLAAAREGGEQKNIDALQAIQPEPWGAENITPHIGATWIPEAVYTDFVHELTGDKGSSVRFTRGTNTFSVFGQSSGQSGKWGTPARTPQEIIQSLLNSRTIKITYRDRDGTTYVDHEATDAANLKAEEIREEFAEWVFRDSGRRETLTGLFNDKFNNIVLRQRDGSHLTFPGKVPDAIISLRRHQKNAIWRGITDRFVLYDHAVGAGKTYTGIARAMERKRMGLSRKPMIIVPNHLVEQFAADVYRLYPGAKVLAATKKDTQKRRRRRLFAKIATGDWDVIIMPHSSFGFIGIAPETEQRYLVEEIKAAEEALREAQEQQEEENPGSRFTSPSVKQAEASLDKLTSRLDAIKNKSGKKDRLLTFEQMGIDDLTVDECFTYNTLIETNVGKLKIGDIVTGRLNVLVKSFDFINHVVCWKPIVGWFTNRRTKQLVEVKHETGSFICTAAHKVWTSDGYQAAATLSRGQTVFTSGWTKESENYFYHQAVLGVPGGVCLQVHGDAEQRQSEVLFRSLCAEGKLAEGRICGELQGSDGPLLGELPAQRETIPSVIEAHERAQSNAQLGDQGENGRDSQGEAVPGAERGKWNRVDGTAGASCGTHSGTTPGACRQNQSDPAGLPEPSESLQGGPCFTAGDGGHRAGWTLPQDQARSREGRQEEQGFTPSRVESVTVLQPGSDGRYAFSGDDHSLMYDIEVEDTHNYYANGVLVSNCHEFKNLFYNSNLNVRGMNPKTGSGKAYDLWNKIRVLRESPRGAVAFMTGTPISNSAVEMYILMRYLGLDYLQDIGLEHFDAWRNDFTTVSTQFEPTESGRGLKEVNRIGRDWVNMRKLMDAYYQFADSVTNEDIIKWYAEDNDGAQFPLPEVEGGARQSIAVKPTPAQEEIIQDIVSGFNSLEDIKNPNERSAERLRLMNRAREVSLDAREVGGTSDEKGGKLERVSQEVFRVYKKWDADKGTQLVFLDRSIPKAAPKDKERLRQYDALVAEADRAEAVGDDETYRKAQDRLEQYDANEMEAVRRSQTGGWNAYQQIKDNLVAMGIPAGEIRFIHEANTDLQKAELFEQVNTGTVRVLIGSTPRMGAGTNVQERLVALHHVDVTWKPSDIEQREGRIIRQGNDLYGKYGHEKFKVEIMAYVTETTVDAKLWSLNATKLKMINGIRKYGGEFNMEFEDADSVGMAEIAAIASGDPLQLERVKLSAAIDKLHRQRKAHRRQMYGYEDRLKRAKQTIKAYPAAIERSTKVVDLVETAQAAAEEKAKARTVAINGKTFSFGAADGVKEALELLDTLRPNKPVESQGDDLVRQTMRRLMGIAEDDAPKPDKDGGGKFSVDIDGELFTSYTKAVDKVREVLGDGILFDATLNGESFIRKTDAARVLADILGKLDSTMGNDAEIASGQINGVDVKVTADRVGTQLDVFITGSLVDQDGQRVPIIKEEQTYKVEPGKGPSTAGIKNLLDKASSGGGSAWSHRREVEYMKSALKEAEADIKELSDVVDKPFSKEQELADKTARLDAVEAELASREGGSSGTARVQVQDQAQPITETDRTYVIADTTRADGKATKSVLIAAIQEARKHLPPQNPVAGFEGLESVTWQKQKTFNGKKYVETLENYSLVQHNNDGDWQLYHRFMQEQTPKGIGLKFDDLAKAKVYAEYYLLGKATPQGEPHIFTGRDGQYTFEVPNSAYHLDRFEKKVAGGYSGPIYSMAQEEDTDTSATHSAESLRKELRGKLGAARLSQLIDAGRVRIHDSAGAFKAATGRSATGTTGRLIQGMYVDGVVHLIAPHIKENEGFAVLRHELGVHAGRMMQTEEAFQRILDSIMARKDEVSETGTAIRKAIKRVPEGTKSAYYKEEILSYLVELSPEIGIVRRFMALLKRMLVKIGFSRDIFTTADFVAMAESALRRDARDGGVAGAPVGAMASVSQEMTDAFKSWFGKSKVTEGGQPKVVYHGSPTFGKGENFTFDPDRADGKTKTPGRGLGTFFAADRTESVGYAATGGTVEGVYLRVENPLVINSYQIPAFNSVEEAKAFRRRKQLEGHDGIHIKDEDHWVIFDANQAKSVDKNTGAFSRADNDIRHSEAAEAFDREDIPAAGKIIVKRHAKPDISAFWKHLSSPEWYMRKYRAAREILNTQLKRHEDKFTMENEILGDFVPFMEEMQKDDPTNYAEATDILLAKDKPGSKWFGIQPEAVWSATLDGKWVASAESVAKLDKIIQKESAIEGRPLGDYKKEATDNWIVTRDKKPIKTYNNEREAIDALSKAEDAQLQRDGVSDGARMIVRRFRAMTNTAFDKMIADLRRIQKEFRDMEVNEPTVEIDRPWVLERDGKAIGSFNSEADATAAMHITHQVMSRKPGMTAKKIGQLNVRERTGKDARQPVSLSQLIADMNSLRGTYFPRQRPPGGVIMRAYKEDKKLLEKFDFYMIGKDHIDPVTGEVLRSRPSKIIEKMTQGINAASGYLPFIPTLEKRARELRNQGYTVVIERDDSMPETIFEVAKLTSSMDALLRGAAAKLKGEEGQRAVVEETKKMLTAYVADIIKQRGYLASRMTRTDEYWEGFETDPLLAGTQYARGIASGLAKREAAQKMFAFFTGRDVTWKQWKDANPDGKWAEYDKMVEEKRIDPKQQPALYKETLEFIEDALRNEEQTDRIISTLKGLAVVKFLGFRVSSALVNLTNMVMAVPASISAGSKGGIGNAFKAIGNAAVQYAQYRRANGKMSVEDRKVFMEITNRGWDAAQFNQENATVLMSKAGKGYAKFVEYSMLMFGEVERINRATTIFAAYKELRRNTALDEDAALQQAKEISDNAHGIYTKTTVPPWVRNMPAAKLIYTFQKFMHNYTLNMVDMGMKGQNKELAYMLLSPILLGGIQGSLATTAILAIASGLGSDVPEEDFYNWAEETFGSDTFFRQGLPASLFGVSLKGSIQINNPMPRNLTEVAGAPGSVVMDIYKGLGHIKDGEFMKGGEALLPTAFGGLIKAFREGSEGISTGTYGHVFYGDEPLRATTTDQITRALSFNPARISGIREKQWNEKREVEAFRERREKVNTQIKRYYLFGKGDYQELAKEIQRYNELAIGTGRVDIPRITGRSIRTMLKRAQRPSKIERQRAATMQN